MTSSLVRRTGGLFLALTAVLASVSCSASDQQARTDYCAIMPDSVGLYVDNPVTQMGYRIGRVTSIAPSDTAVRVDFTIERERALPAEVTAVIRSTSILADRSLELVGNYREGAKLAADKCIPLDRGLTPKSLSQVIGASTEFVDAISPEGSTNIAGVVRGVDEALRNQGPAANQLLTTAARVLDSPDQAIGDLGSIVTNLGLLTDSIVDLEPTLRGVFADSVTIGPELQETTKYAAVAFEGIIPILTLAADLETHLGPQIQQLLDATGVAIRKMTPRAPFYASILNAGPRLINGAINLANSHQPSTLRYRPPLYRVRTPDGVLQCNIMNASLPGSCANVQGTPYAVDVALLQYVLTQANR